MDTFVKFASINAECEHWKTEAHKHCHENADTQKELAEFQESSQQLEAELEATLEQKEKQCRDLLAIVQQMELDTDMIRQRHVSGQKEYAALEDRCLVVSAELDQLKNYTRKLEQINDNLERDLRVVNENFNCLTAQFCAEGGSNKDLRDEPAKQSTCWDPAPMWQKKVASKHLTAEEDNWLKDECGQWKVKALQCLEQHVDKELTARRDRAAILELSLRNEHEKTSRLNMKVIEQRTLHMQQQDEQQLQQDRIYELTQELNVQRLAASKMLGDDDDIAWPASVGHHSPQIMLADLLQKLSMIETQFRSLKAVPIV